MNQKVKVLFSVFLVVVAVGFARGIVLRGQANAYENVVRVDYCKDFNKLSSTGKELWADGWNTAVMAVLEEKDQAEWQLDFDDFVKECKGNPNLPILDAIVEEEK